jgi:outer membrane protein/S-layer protein transport system outer membrane protein
LKLLQINQDTVAVLEKQLSDTEAKDTQRVVTRTDVFQARARLSQARSQLAAIQTQLAVSRANYLAVVGRNPGELAPPPPLEGLPATLDQAFDAAEANNPQLLSARYAEIGSRARTAQAKAQGMPSVTARLDFQRQPFLPYSARPYDDIRSASVTLSMPLYTGGQIASGVRQAVQENNRDRLTIEDTRLQVLQEVTSAWEQLSGARSQLKTLRDEMTSDEVAFYGVRQEEKFALRSTIEVLNAELELSNAQQNLVRTEATEYLGRVQLLEAAGVLSVDQLSPGAAVYDPTVNFRKVKDAGFRPLEAPAHLLDNLV